MFAKKRVDKGVVLKGSAAPFPPFLQNFVLFLENRD